MVKNTDLKVFQSNNLTIATHNMNALQKNVVYRILMYCRDDLAQKRNKNLFGQGTIIYFKKANLVKGPGDLAKLDRDLKDLRERSIILKLNDGTKIITGVILRAVVKPHKDVAIEICDYFIDFARHCYKEFTAYQFKVAFHLKGVHAKRLYEICCMIKNLEDYKVSFQRLKEMLCVAEKHKRLYNFENVVLKPAQKRINECEAAEVSFDYEFERENREVFVVLKVKDKKKEAEKLENLKAGGELTPKQKMNQAAIYLKERFGKKHKYYEIFNVLKAKGQIADFVVKYREKLNYYEKKGKSDEEFQKIITKILKEDFGIDLKDYRKEGVGIKKRPKPKTLRGQISFLTK